MEGILKFKLPETEYEFYLASNAGKLASALHEIDAFLRNKQKYGDSDSILIEEVRKFFREATEGIDLEG